MSSALAGTYLWSFFHVQGNHSGSPDPSTLLGIGNIPADANEPYALHMVNTGRQTCAAPVWSVTDYVTNSIADDQATAMFPAAETVGTYEELVLTKLQQFKEVRTDASAAALHLADQLEELSNDIRTAFGTYETFVRAQLQQFKEVSSEVSSEASAAALRLADQLEELSDDIRTAVTTIIKDERTQTVAATVRRFSARLIKATKTAVAAANAAWESEVTQSLLASASERAQRFFAALRQGDGAVQRLAYAWTEEAAMGLSATASSAVQAANIKLQMLALAAANQISEASTRASSTAMKAASEVSSQAALIAQKQLEQQLAASPPEVQQQVREAANTVQSVVDSPAAKLANQAVASAATSAKATFEADETQAVIASAAQTAERLGVAVQKGEGEAARFLAKLLPQIAEAISTGAVKATQITSTTVQDEASRFSDWVAQAAPVLASELKSASGQVAAQATQAAQTQLEIQLAASPLVVQQASRVLSDRADEIRVAAQSFVDAEPVQVVQREPNVEAARRSLRSLLSDRVELRLSGYRTGLQTFTDQLSGYRTRLLASADGTRLDVLLDEFDRLKEQAATSLSENPEALSEAIQQVQKMSSSAVEAMPLPQR
eukprot:CAMPEP_0119305758 /NCGR_PEP_ID=MMETSP1333-20130426/6688_1 /TAXON_ID=418940 /ORGANISM="Scyphosphaera apsteinii, Strain RCC1455" /LENGTH=608 /DNA_ID=CAMNT_0007308933 /DNA_START=78 /DNA_END=1905 /DNA_ORIENTATION=+